jgi:hypothetical protein
MILSIPYLEKYPSTTQTMLRSKIKDIVDETFVFPADYDYLNARWLSINRLYRPFFWAALQAIEKYLKANLLYHGVPVKDYSHKILRMASELETYDSVIKDIDLIPAASHAILLEDDLWGSTDINDFLDAIYKYGDPNNRYDFYGTRYEISYLFKLDHVVHALRTNVADVDFMHKVKNLDKLSYFAYEQNYYFAPMDYEHQSIWEILGARFSVPSIEIALKGGYGHSHVFEKWLKENIKIEKKQIEKIKNS